MDNGIISLRYARALQQYAAAHSEQERVYDETGVLVQSFGRYGALKRVLGNLLVPDAKKAEVIEACSGGEVSPCFGRFIRLVLHEDREALLHTICLSYRQLVRQSHNLMDVEVTTAVAVDEATQQKLQRRLETLTGQTVRIRGQVDPSIIGGYVFRWDTYRLDASARAALQKIEKSLMTYGR